MEVKQWSIPSTKSSIPRLTGYWRKQRSRGVSDRPIVVCQWNIRQIITISFTESTRSALEYIGQVNYFFQEYNFYKMALKVVVCYRGQVLPPATGYCSHNLYPVSGFQKKNSGLLRRLP